MFPRLGYTYPSLTSTELPGVSVVLDGRNVIRADTDLDVVKLGR